MAERVRLSMRIAERLLRLGLRTWPPARRLRDGDALVTAFGDGGREAGWGPLRLAAETLTELVAIVWAGVGMRVNELGGGMMGWGSDVRFALRSLVKSPGFAATVSLTLALGIGANAAVFHLVDRALFDPLPIEDPDRVVVIWNTLGDSPKRLRVAAPDVAFFEENSSTVESFAFANRATDGAIETTLGDGVEHVRVAAVTADFFEVVGGRAAIGRVFTDEEARDRGPGEAVTPPSLVLSHGLWVRSFGADPGVVGSSVLLYGHAATVVGVMPENFRVPVHPETGVETDVDLWVPFRTPLSAIRRADGRRVDQDSDNTGAVFARLAQGANVPDAQRELAGFAAELRTLFPSYQEAGLDVVVAPIQRDATAHLRPLLISLLLGVGLVLLVACVNLSTLLLSRGIRRRTEIAVRMALGAGRGRVARQLVTEGAILSLIGVALSVAVAEATALGLSFAVPESVAVAGANALGGRALAFLAATAVLASALLSGIPALQLSARGTVDLGGAFLRGAGSHRRLRGALVTAQIAASVALLAGVSLFVRSGSALRQVEPGFEAAGALTFNVSLRIPDRYRGPGERAELMREIERRLGEEPGVTRVGLTGHLPLSGRQWTQPYGREGEAPETWERNRADFRAISSSYFAAAGTRILEGRGFLPEEDLVEERRVVVVDETLAARIAPAGSAVGQRIGFPLDGADVIAEIVGVVEHVRHGTLAEEGREAIYVPYRQEASRDVAFVVRTTGEPNALAPSVRRIMRSIDPQVPFYGVRAFEDYVSDQLAPTRLGVGVLAGLALLGFLAVAVGLYGLVAMEVSDRTREIGVRIAIGAERSAVIASVVGMGARLGVWGLGIGVGVAVLAWRGFAGVFFGVTLADPTIWVTIVAVVGVTVTGACWLPALRAARLDPTEALRAD